MPPQTHVANAFSKIRHKLMEFLSGTNQDRGLWRSIMYVATALLSAQQQFGSELDILLASTLHVRVLPARGSVF